MKRDAANREDEKQKIKGALRGAAKALGMRPSFTPTDYSVEEILDFIDSNQDNSELINIYRNNRLFSDVFQCMLHPHSTLVHHTPSPYRPHRHRFCRQTRKHTHSKGSQCNHMASGYPKGKRNTPHDQ